MRRHHRPSARWWLIKSALVASAALAAGSYLASLSSTTWLAAAAVLAVGPLLSLLRRRRRGGRRAPRPPQAGESTVNQLVGERVDLRLAASNATGAIAGLVHALALRQVPTSELATEIVTGWHPHHGIAVIDLVMGVNSGRHEVGNQWLAANSPDERWWWAQFEVDLRHVASGTRTNALFDLAPANAAVSNEEATR